MLILFFALVGAIIGSFANVIIYRLPLMIAGSAITLSWPPSHCPACSQPVKIRHNIPVIGWLLLRGRCARCRQAISWRYPLVETAMALLFAFIIWRQGVNAQSLFDLLAIALLVPLLAIDLRTMLLPDKLTLSLLALALVMAACGSGRVDMQLSLAAAAIGFAIPWLLSRLFRWRYGYEGMGQGDMKLFAALGAWLGPEALCDIFALSSILALVVALLLLRVKPGQPFPFGPYPIIVALGWIARYH